MRRRAILMTTAAVAVAVLFLGIPAILFGSLRMWDQARDELETRANSIAQVVERREEAGGEVTSELLELMVSGGKPENAYVTVTWPESGSVSSKTPISGATLTDTVITSDGAMVTVSVPRSDVLRTNLLLIAGTILLAMLAILIGVAVAMRQSRRLSAPLIYLAASAEQIGAGQVRPKMEPSGIEEIDLVYQELERTAARMAARIAAERQFSADAAHQLRTPLAALSLRIEEIEYLSEEPEVIEEARIALEQIDRLGGVIDEIMAKSTSSHRTTEATRIAEVFEQQEEEWKVAFLKAGRTLTFANDAGAVLVSPGTLSQVLATLIENSLKYGGGTTSVSAHLSGKAVQFKIADEGDGVSEDVADEIFTKGVSAGGSTGIGLAVAKELVEADGGRLELTRRVPAEFTLTLAAVPSSFDPNTVVPQGALVNVGARRQRR